MHQCVREIPPNYNRFESTLHQPSKMEISWALDFKDCFFYPSKNSTSWEYFRWIVGCWMCSAFRFFHDLDHFSGLRRTNNSISTNLQPFSSELIRTAGFFWGKMIEEPSFGCFWTAWKERGILDSLKELTQQMDDFVAWVRPEKISSTT